MIKVENIVKSGFIKRRNRWLLFTSILILILVVLAILELILGNTIYPVKTILNVLNGQTIKGATFTIMKLRLPRMLAGVLVGMALGISGNTFQTMLKNPLASPDIIGISSGASVGALFCILVLGVSGNIVSIVALTSGLVLSSIIYLLSRFGGFTGGKLILIGIGMQAMMKAVLSFLLLKASQYDVPGAYRWLSGNLNGVQMSLIPRLAFVVAVFGFLIIIMGQYLKILELGEQSAITLGVKTNVVRITLILSSVCLISFSTAVTGPIAFISFLSGPIAKKIVGAGNSNVLPSGLIGGILVLAGDLVGQYAFGVRLPVGIITGMLGAPYLLLLLVRMNKKGNI